MDQQQVDVAGLQFSQTFIDRLPDGLATISHDVRGNLRREEYLLSWHSAVKDTLAYLGLVLIALRRVNVTEPSFQGQAHILSGSLST